MKTPNTLSRALGLIGAWAWLGAGPAAAVPSGELDMAIQHPAEGTVLAVDQTSIEVQGGASVFGGVKQLDVVLVIDTSSSLKNTDPKDYRMSGAVELVRSLPDWSDIQIGVVAFGRSADLLSPLTTDREAAVDALHALGRGSTTNLAAGIDTALQAFDDGAREGSTRVMLVFTDGRSNEKKAQQAMQRAKARGVSIHSLLLGTDMVGQRMLRAIASETGGSFLFVTDPSQLPAAFRDLRTTGVEKVELSVNEGPPVEAAINMGSFAGEVPLVRGENRITATVTSRDGTTRSETVLVTVRSEGCAELAVEAVRDGQPALSLSNRSVEIVMDASRSMWGQIDGVAKMEIAKKTLEDALHWLPEDVTLSLRAYGHRHTPGARSCTDTQLLVPASINNREAIRGAVARLKPRGATPLGYALEQVAGDFAGVAGEHAVVLVTDGIESCGGNAAAAARGLQSEGPVPVHVIGFGLEDASAEDLASLRSIAEASGGRFVTADSARELQDALMTTVGTSYSVFRGDRPMGSGTLGSDQVLRLPAGDYRVELDSVPPMETRVSLESEVRQTVVFSSAASGRSSRAWRETTDYNSCEAQVAALERSEQMEAAASPASPGLASVSEIRPSRRQPTYQQLMRSPNLSTAPAAPAPGPSESASSRSGSLAGSPAAPAKQDGPKARREVFLQVEGGSVEVWRNLRERRSADFAVVVRHPSVGERPRMIYSGNDSLEAETRALRARDQLRNGEAIEVPSVR